MVVDIRGSLAPARVCPPPFYQSRLSARCRPRQPVTSRKTRAESLTCAVAFSAHPSMLGVVRWLWHRWSTRCWAATPARCRGVRRQSRRPRRRADDADHPRRPTRCGASSPPRASWAWPGPTWPATSTSRAASATCSRLRDRMPNVRLDPRVVAPPGEELGGWREVRRLEPPPEEARLHGRRHSKARDAAAIATTTTSPTTSTGSCSARRMTYSCAVFHDPADTLEEAQANKYELICRKLGLEPGMRLLDVGLRLGRHGDARRRAPRRAGGGRHALAPAGRAGREAGGRGRAVRTTSRSACRTTATSPTARSTPSARSACSSTSGEARLGEYFGRLRALLRPQGRLLNHGISRPSGQRRPPARAQLHRPLRVPRRRAARGRAGSCR